MAKFWYQSCKWTRSTEVTHDAQIQDNPIKNDENQHLGHEKWSEFTWAFSDVPEFFLTEVEPRTQT